MIQADPINPLSQQTQLAVLDADVSGISRIGYKRINGLE